MSVTANNGRPNHATVPEAASQGASHQRSIVTRVRVAIAGVSAVVVLLAFAVFWVAWSAYQVERRTTELGVQLSALSAAEQVGSQQQLSADLRDQLLRIEARLLGAALFVTDASGAVVRSSEQGSSLRAVDLAALGPTRDDGSRQAVIAAADGTRVLVVGVPIDGTRWLVAIQRLADLRRAQTGVAAAAIAGALVAVLVAWFAGGWLAGRLTRPLLQLQAGAQRIASGEYGSHVEVNGDVEVVSLASSFNEMSDRVAQAYEAQRAFVGDVSHEIKTPITSIGGFARALLDGTAATEQQRQDAAGVIVAETARVEELTQTLLSLAQLDAGATALRVERIDLGQLADALSGRFASRAGDVGRVSVELTSTSPPLGDTDRLLQCATALVVNALAHGGDHVTVRVHDEVTQGHWRLLVDDDGPGIPQHSREEVFERFTRLDGSRSSASGGAGLGLAICARLVALMSGRIWAEDSPSGGARFVIELPAG